MPKLWTIGATTIVSILAWAALVLVGTSEGWWHSSIVKSAEPDAFMPAAKQMVEEQHGGNLAMVLIEDGEIADSHYVSVGEPVDLNSRFQVASLSKWITAWGVMALVEDGKIDLDKPVSKYLTRWQLPPSEFDNDGVTVRRLLSHTAGLGDGLGYDGFDRQEDVQSLEDSLTQAQDASPGNSGIVKVTQKPGEEWNYSGGGFTLLQLLIEEVSGQSFSAYMKERIFQPLEMNQTTFDYDEVAEGGLAENYDGEGQVEPLNRYTSLAATSLHTSPKDMALFVQAHSPVGAKSGGSVLSAETLETMRVPHGSQMGADIWGLGTILYASNNRGDFIIGHDGNNEPAINTAVRLDPATGDGIVVLGTGNGLLATKLAGEWVFLKTGNIDFLLFSMKLGSALRLTGVGALVILIIGIAIGIRSRRRRKANQNT